MITAKDGLLFYGFYDWQVEDLLKGKKIDTPYGIVSFNKATNELATVYHTTKETKVIKLPRVEENTLKKLREACGMTQAQLAEAANVSLRSLQKYETGERDLAKAEAATVLKIARALDTTVESLIS